MMTRREMSRALTLIFTALFPGGSAANLQAGAPSVHQNPQDHMQGIAAVAAQTLIQKPLAEMANPEVTMLTLTVAPGAASPPHKHTGPVFAYLLEGEIENQVDPNPPRRYKPGEFFYEPPMHVHQSLRNLSATKPAKLLIFEIGQRGKPFTVGAR
jgi:quercetin dioxygenase-like cupin family protein